MRTRIALVAAIPVAFITLSMLSPAASFTQATKLAPAKRSGKTGAMSLPPHQLTAFHAPSVPAASKRSAFPLDLSAALLEVHPSTPSPTAGAPSGRGPAGSPAPAPTTLTAARATPPAPPAPAAAPAPSGPVDTVTPLERAEWEEVAMCEEGGDWSASGPLFSGGLGITRTNWIAYGGEEFAPEGAMATEDQQIMVAERIQPDPPDQDGCSGW